jgi:amidohydrolase
MKSIGGVADTMASSRRGTVPETQYLRDLAAAAAPDAVALRREIHRHPELGNQEFHTTEAVAAALGGGVTARRRQGRTGLVAEVGSAGPVVAFRADLDALPIEERTGLDFSSRVSGVMHACGHDVHTAIAVGIAKVLSQVDDLGGRVRFLFQPAEETFPGGAVELIREGAMTGVRAMIGFHVDPTLRPGKVALLAGPVTSSSDRVSVVIEGPGGHTARPHQTVDTVYAAARVATELPGLLARLTDPRSPQCLVFGQIHGGEADNVIPTTVELSGTSRTLSRALWEELPGLVDRLVADLVTPTGAKARVEFQRGIPPVVNDATITAQAEIAVAETLGVEAVTTTEPSMGAEDFARYLDLAPGTLMRLGAAPEGRKVDLHSATFDVDEAAIEVGILAGSAVLTRLLRSTAAS